MDELKKTLATPRGKVLAAILAVVVAGGAAFLAFSALGSGSSPAEAAPPTHVGAKTAVVHHARTSGTTTTNAAVTTTAATTTAATTTTAAPPAKPAKTSSLHKAPPKKPAEKPSTPAVSISNEVPPAIGAALIDHPLVVVSVYSPEAVTDETARDEARAGAKTAGAGFVAINADSDTELQLLDSLTTVTADPTLLILDRTGKVLFQTVGFLDQDTVAQAVANAAVGLNNGSDAAPPSQPYDGYWMAKADKIICASNADISAMAQDPTAGAIRRHNARAWQTFNQLTALRAVGPTAADYRVFLGYMHATLSDADTLAAALKKNDVKTFNKAARAFSRDYDKSLTVEAKMGVLCLQKGSSTHH